MTLGTLTAPGKRFIIAFSISSLGTADTMVVGREPSSIVFGSELSSMVFGPG
jgi:hypothetical protein